MMYPPCTLYVIRCQTPRHWYVGQTNRLPWERLQEHEEGTGSLWTRKHGVDCMIFSAVVEPSHANRLESELTTYLMSRYGWANVRGGMHMRCRDDDRTQKFWLPAEFRRGSFRDILKLRSGSVSHLSPELGRLVNLFSSCRDAKHPYHLHTKITA